MKRRALLQLLALAACGAAPQKPPPVPEAPLTLAPLTELVASAGLEWLLVLEPRALAEAPISLLIPEERFALFAARHGGFDPRKAEELVIAGYPKTTLALARGALDPGAVERAFAARAVRIEGRSVDLQAGPRSTLVRTWGEFGRVREQLVLFGDVAAGFEIGAFGPLRAAELFAQNKLKRASPAFRSPPLDRAAEVLGPAPARLFIPGPFQGEMASAMGGLLGIASAAGISAHVIQSSLFVRCVITGVTDLEPGAARVGATFDRLAESGLGRLCGLDRPKKGPTAGHREDTLTLEVELDAQVLAKGLRDATQSRVDELLRL